MLSRSTNTIKSEYSCETTKTKTIGWWSFGVCVCATCSSLSLHMRQTETETTDNRYGYVGCAECNWIILLSFTHTLLTMHNLCVLSIFTSNCAISTSEFPYWNSSVGNRIGDKAQIPTSWRSVLCEYRITPIHTVSYSGSPNGRMHCRFGK